MKTSKEQLLKAALTKISLMPNTSIWEDSRDDAAREMTQIASDALQAISGNFPNRPGVWEWFDVAMNKHLVLVGRSYPDTNVFHVVFNGGHYNVAPYTDEVINLKGEIVHKEFLVESQWPETWGKYVGPYKDFDDQELLLNYPYDKLHEIWGDINAEI